MAGMSVSTGLISGMDTGSLITQLMQVEANPQTLLKKQLSTTQSMATAYRAINTRFDALRTAAEAVQTATTWTASRATPSSTTVSATAGPAATPGAMTFSVDQLAATHAIISNQTWTMVGAQTPATVGYGANTLDVTVGGVTTTLSLDTDADGTATLAEAAAAINAKTDLGLTATTVQVSTGVYRLQVTSNKSGAAAAAFDVGGPGTFTVVTQGVDAQLTVGTGAGKYSVTSATNTFNGLLNDTSVSVSEKTPSVTVSVTSDPAAVTARVKSLVDAANGLLSSISSYTDASSGAALLKGDSTLRAFAGQVLDAVSSAIGGTSAAVAGLELTRTGTLKFDAEKFTTKLNTEPALVKKLFTGAAVAVGPDGLPSTPDDIPAVTGIAAKLQALALNASDDTTGTITVLATSKDTKAKGLEDRIRDWDARLALRKTALTRQFTAMETALGRLQNQSNWLSSQIGSLPSWSASNK
jgi:flagellar hook-associated protein 2